MGNSSSQWAKGGGEWRSLPITGCSVPAQGPTAPVYLAVLAGCLAMIIAAIFS